MALAESLANSQLWLDATSIRGAVMRYQESGNLHRDTGNVASNARLIEQTREEEFSDRQREEAREAKLIRPENAG